MIPELQLSVPELPVTSRHIESCCGAVRVTSNPGLWEESSWKYKCPLTVLVYG